MGTKELEKKSSGGGLVAAWKQNPLVSTGLVLILMIVVQTAIMIYNFGEGSVGELMLSLLTNWLNILRNNAPVGIIALGMTFVIISGGIDLSVGSTLVGVGSSICGGSAIAATAPVIDADDEEVAQAISVIFFFNVLAAILFPSFGKMLGFDTLSGNAFGVFAGTAINDTSSVTAAASTWDGMWNLGSATLDKAVTVKLTRTLAIIPITLFLAFIRTRNEEKYDRAQGQSVSFKDIFPFFILYFMAASILTTIALKAGVPMSFFQPIKELSKFFIVLAMAAIGLNTNLVKLIKTGGKPIFMGACCWAGITAVSLLLQSVLGIW